MISNNVGIALEQPTLVTTMAPAAAPNFILSESSTPLSFDEQKLDMKASPAPVGLIDFTLKLLIPSCLTFLIFSNFNSTSIGFLYS